MSTYPLRKLIPDATMASVCFLLPPGSQMISYLVKEKFGEKKIFGKFFFRKKIFSPIPPFIVFGDLKVHFGIVWLPLCLLIPLRAIWWHCFAAAWLVAGNLHLGRGVSMARVGALHR